MNRVLRKSVHPDYIFQNITKDCYILRTWLRKYKSVHLYERIYEMTCTLPSAENVEERKNVLLANFDLFHATCKAIIRSDSTDFEQLVVEGDKLVNVWEKVGEAKLVGDIFIDK